MTTLTVWFDGGCPLCRREIALMRRLWEGDFVTTRGTHYAVENARIYTLPDEPVPVYVSAFGPKALEVAARIGDGWCTTSDDADEVARFKELSGGKVAQAGCKAAWADTVDEGVDQVAVVDRASAVARQFTTVGFTPFKLASGMGSVWITNAGNAQTTGSVSRLEPSSRDLRPLQDPIPLRNAPIEMAVGADRLFVANYGSATISVLGPAG